MDAPLPGSEQSLYTHVYQPERYQHFSHISSGRVTPKAFLLEATYLTSHINLIKYTPPPAIVTLQKDSQRPPNHIYYRKQVHNKMLFIWVHLMEYFNGLVE